MREGHGYEDEEQSRLEISRKGGERKQGSFWGTDYHASGIPV